MDIFTQALVILALIVLTPFVVAIYNLYFK